MADNSKLEALLEQSIQAQNRTTHAVRAIATYLLIQVAWGIAAGVLIVFGIANPLDPNVVLVALGMLAVVAGFFHAFGQAMSELAKSEAMGAPSQAWNSQNSSGAPEVTNDSDWSSDDWVNAQRVLDYKEMKAWDKAGRPSLAKWVSLDKPNFYGWLQNGPF